MPVLGVCFGSSTLSMVSVNQDRSVENVWRRAHEGNPKRLFLDMADELGAGLYDRIALTGRGLKKFLDLTAISEPEAIESAFERINGKPNPKNPPIRAIVSAGGETFIVYQLDPRGRISKVYTGNKCASGTGEFFIQQIRRMNVDIEAAIRYSRDEKPHPVSGRCSVFCKSDCTHATNIGVPKGQVIAGLCEMMAEKVLGLLKDIPLENILMIGGTTQITPFVRFLKQKIHNLVIPQEAVYFEALGAALWALDNPTKPYPEPSRLFVDHHTQFDYHPPLASYENRVHFTAMDRGTARAGDACVLGLDVGSTTTKAVLLRESDNRILAGEYLRTYGDPVRASRLCYASLCEQLSGVPITVRGLGVTGSGRKIAGLHALTEAVYNEIIAHAEAALFFDPDVDTIFEIGGQDAKYTYIFNGVASDYAMNEACSAGTGSFLEEAAKETLAIEMEDIADWAIRGKKPPNFNDQCAAFISSDIKNAFQEGIGKEDVIAGLVYSVCMNYVNRVKGARPVGNKVFMQGGVCYNRAVPMAMAALSGKEIVVPPEPGLMGAFGVALETKKRMQEGLLAPARFDLRKLADREVTYGKPFTCPGGAQRCDLGCEINRIAIEGQTYPFGGSCNRYYNIRHRIKADAGALDYVRKRQQLVFEEFAPDVQSIPPDAPSVGILPSFLTNTFYPLYAHFFANLGFRPQLVSGYSPEGLSRNAAPFCYPAELAHGYMLQALENTYDYLFLPHIKGVAVDGGQSVSKTCPLLQGEPYYLTATFTEIDTDDVSILTPVLDFSLSSEEIEKAFLGLSASLKSDRKSISASFRAAWAAQQKLFARFKESGRRALRQLQDDPEAFAVILCGRPYNAFPRDANKGIPHKFASRGVAVIPVDFLDLKDVQIQDHMYWASGQRNLKAAEFMKTHPQLFGVYITNFSCGPDAFIVSYYREALGRKPSLTLELDNHTADAGLETRVEAFLDIIQRYRLLESTRQADVERRPGFRPAATRGSRAAFEILDSQGRAFKLNDPRVRVVIPSVGQRTSQILTAVFEGLSVDALTLPSMDEVSLKLGRANTSCKECLPLQLTMGSLIHYLENDRPKDEITVYFVPQADGPCRLGQYGEFMKAYVRRNRIPDVTFLSLTDEDGYAGLGVLAALRIFNAWIISSVFDDMYYNLRLNAVDVDEALSLYENAWNATLEGIRRNVRNLPEYMRGVALSLKNIRQKHPLETLPTVLLTGEAFVRSEDFARKWLPERLLQAGLLTHVAPMHEYIMYIDWCVRHRITKLDITSTERLKHFIGQKVKRRTERTLKRVMAESGCYVPRFIDIEHTLNMAAPFISPKLKGETCLTVGGALAEVGSDFCGTIAVGPFGCMPNRLSESILNQKMERKWLLVHRHDDLIEPVTRDVESLPFLAIESDGNPFPPLLDARLETFIIQAKRMHRIMMDVKNLSASSVAPR